MDFQEVQMPDGTPKGRLQKQWNETCALRKINAEMLAALRDIEWIFDGKEDITDNGGPNDAMNALAVVRTAIRKATGA